MTATSQRVVDEFRQRFGHQPELVVRAPGRLNLIGEHTDYNGGWVLPITIDQATYLAMSKGAPGRVEAWSLEKGPVGFSTDGLESSGGWEDYLKGILAVSQLSLTPGWKVVVGTDIPVGAGLSSSAALAMGWAYGLVILSGSNWDALGASGWGERAENEVVGMRCGPMDHMAVSLGEVGKALLIDCSHRGFRKVALPDDAQVVVMDTGTRRELVEVSYGDRRAECEQIAAKLGIAPLTALIPSLKDTPTAQLESVFPQLSQIELGRIRHLITEQGRTEQMVTGLTDRDHQAVGELMTESHRSLAKDYSVSSPYLDRMVDIAIAHPACWGARMTGGGFGGCAIAWVQPGQPEEVENFTEAVANQYREQTGIEPHLFAIQPSPPVGPLSDR